MGFDSLANLVVEDRFTPSFRLILSALLWGLARARCEVSKRSSSLAEKAAVVRRCSPFYPVVSLLCP